MEPVDDMPDWVEKAIGLSRGMVEQNATDHRMGYHAVVWLADRLTALETELEGYRKGKLDALTVEAQRNGEYAIPHTSGLPCSSEYASTGYIEGVPFVERGDESGG